MPTLSPEHNAKQVTIKISPVTWEQGKLLISDGGRDIIIFNPVVPRIKPPVHEAVLKMKTGITSRNKP
jgi:hypothetical protein